MGWGWVGEGRGILENDPSPWRGREGPETGIICAAPFATIVSAARKVETLIYHLPTTSYLLLITYDILFVIY